MWMRVKITKWLERDERTETARLSTSTRERHSYYCSASLPLHHFPTSSSSSSRFILSPLFFLIWCYCARGSLTQTVAPIRCVWSHSYAMRLDRSDDVDFVDVPLRSTTSRVGPPPMSYDHDYINHTNQCSKCALTYAKN